MQRIATPPLDLRLQRRYAKMVQGHLHSIPQLAAGISALPDANRSFAAVQGAWRFLNNERVTLAALAEPLRQTGVERVHAESGVGFSLLVHD